MKRFKKLVSVLTLTAMLAASLTACGGKDPVAEDDSTAGTTTADSSTATTETSGDSTFTYAISGTLQRLSMLLQHLTVGDYLL